MKKRLLAVLLLALAIAFSVSACKVDSDGNSYPIITSSAPNDAYVGSLYTYHIVCADADMADQILMLYVGYKDTCHGFLVNNGGGFANYSFVPVPGMRPACDIEITCSDSINTFTQQTTITIH